MSKRDLRKWEVRGERELLDASPFLKVSAQRIELPDGRIVENFYQLAMPDFASIFAETEDGRILVLRAYRHGAKRICLAAPGGHLSPGEAPLAAAKRELLEETGYQAAAMAAARQLHHQRQSPLPDRPLLPRERLP